MSKKIEPACFATIAPQNSPAKDSFTQAYLTLAKNSDPYHSHFMYVRDRQHRIHFPTEGDFLPDLKDSPGAYVLAFGEAAKRTSGRWTLGFLAEEHLADQNIQCVLRTRNRAENLSNNYVDVVHLQFNPLSGLLMLIAQSNDTIQILHNGKWEALNGNKHNNISQARGPIKGMGTQALYQETTYFRIYGELEYTITLRTHEDPQSVLVKQRNEFISQNSGRPHAVPPIETIIPKESYFERNNFLLWGPTGGGDNHLIYRALDRQTGDPARVSEFSISSREQLKALENVTRFYSERKRDPRILCPVSKFCSHGNADCRSEKDKVYLIYPAGDGNFASLNWKSIDRDSRLALFFQPLAELSRLHADKTYVGASVISIDNLIVHLHGRMPAASFGCISHVKEFSGKGKDHIAGVEVLAWAQAIAQVIQLEYGYEWGIRVKDGLRKHGQVHPEDEKLASLLGRVLATEHETKPGDISRDYIAGGLGWNIRAGHLANDECWQGLGRWKAIREVLYLRNGERIKMQGMIESFYKEPGAEAKDSSSKSVDKSGAAKQELPDVIMID